MSRTRTIIAAVGATAATASLTVFGVTASAGAATPSMTRLAGSAVPFTSTARVTGQVAGSTKLTVEVWLKSRTAAAQQFAAAVSTPGSKSYHHYLSPAAYTARFGATASAAAKVEKWLRSKGFTSVGADSQRSYVRATAAASAIDSAFGTQLKLYQATKTVNAGRYRLRANDRAISVPASLAGSVAGVTGLNNSAPILPLITQSTRPAARKVPVDAKPTPCSRFYGQHVINNLPKKFGRTSFTVDNCGYGPHQVRAAYGANNVNVGRGQTVALVELGLVPQMFRTLEDYAAANRLPAPAARHYAELSLGRGSACGNFDGEEQLDVEVSHAMAPSANQLVVGGDSCNNGDFGLQGLFNADIAVLDGRGNKPLASIASNSWEGGDESQAPVLSTIEHAYLVRAVGEGVGMYFSAGDGPGVEAPSDDPDAISVGGTSLGISTTGSRLFETGWSDGAYLDLDNQWLFAGDDGGTGGGPSVIWNEPAYQKGVVPARFTKAPGNRSAAPVRSVPDISALADVDTGFLVGAIEPNAKGNLAYQQFVVGGTSVASPLIAGVVAAAQQGQGHAFGLINPAIYKLAGTSALHDPLPFTAKTRSRYRGSLCRIVDCGIFVLDQLDDQSHQIFGGTGQVTAKGYDNMTGVGTPNGQNFIAALRRLK
jgi:subtilase family serine protease